MIRFAGLHSIFFDQFFFLLIFKVVIPPLPLGFSATNSGGLSDVLRLLMTQVSFSLSFLLACFLFASLRSVSLPFAHLLVPSHPHFLPFTYLLIVLSLKRFLTISMKMSLFVSIVLPYPPSFKKVSLFLCTLLT